MMSKSLLADRVLDPFCELQCFMVFRLCLSRLGGFPLTGPTTGLQGKDLAFIAIAVAGIVIILLTWLEGIAG